MFYAKFYTCSLIAYKLQGRQVGSETKQYINIPLFGVIRKLKIKNIDELFVPQVFIGAFQGTLV